MKKMKGGFMKNTHQFGSGGIETLIAVTTSNCRAYFRETGLEAECIRVSNIGRFKDNIGEQLEVEFVVDGQTHSFSIRIIGGEGSIWTHTVGQF